MEIWSDFTAMSILEKIVKASMEEQEWGGFLQVNRDREYTIIDVYIKLDEPQYNLLSHLIEVETKLHETTS